MSIEWQENITYGYAHKLTNQYNDFLDVLTELSNSHSNSESIDTGDLRMHIAASNIEYSTINEPVTDDLERKLDYLADKDYLDIDSREYGEFIKFIPESLDIRQAREDFSRIDNSLEDTEELTNKAERIDISKLMER